jgi:D-alanine-D-alanine ligase
LIANSISEHLHGKKILIEEIKNHIDTALLMTHGKYGEDGKLQSLLELFHISYC